ncbi:hypothetical protein AB7W40_09990 [Providencia rettgeri]
MLTNSLTLNAIIDLISDFIEPFVGRCEAAQANRVPMGTGDFALLSPLRFTRHTTTKEVEGGLTEVRQLDLQVDIYGENAGDRAVALETVWRSHYATENLDGRINPLYSTDSIRVPFVDESRQWLDRYTLTISAQVHIIVPIISDKFNKLDITLEQVGKNDNTFK